MRELSLHILDALQNSSEAGATRVELIVEEDLAADRLMVTIRDNGKGMDEATLARVVDPFYTSRRTRHVGLGIPLLKAATERCNGGLTLTSRLGEGTVLQAVFRHSHIDRAPLGNLTGTLLSFIVGGACDLSYLHRVDDREFAFCTAEIRAELGDVPLSHPVVREWLREYIAEGERSLAG